MKQGPERSVVVLKVKKVTEGMVKTLVRYCDAAAIGSNEIRFDSEEDKKRFEENYDGS